MTNPQSQLDLEPQFDFGPAGRRPGMRLHAIEVLNWGTFDKRVWRLELGGDNALLTGDIGSGKSTLVDAITTLLVPAHRIAYNKAAGAEARERDLRSYVLGHYKSERGEAGLSAKPVALRQSSSYSVILGQFRNEGYDEDVTLAQVFWFKDGHGQPARFYVVADKALSIIGNFSNFGKDINALKKRLRKIPKLEIHDSFPPYGAAFRRRFGIGSEQALELFHQTVSMKSVGDLTDFVRSHMLEPFPVEARINHMIAHFEDLTRAHEAVVKARAQIERLTPIVANCDGHAALAAEAEALRTCREALRAFFAAHKAELLEKRIALLDAELAKASERMTALRQSLGDRQSERDALLQAIQENGGDRLASIGREIQGKTGIRDDRRRRADAYGAIAQRLGMPQPKDADGFLANLASIDAEIWESEVHQADLQNGLTERHVALRKLRADHGECAQEIASLKKRRSNIPGNMLGVRDALCRALKLDAESLPFAGELIEVRKEDSDWEGAAERLLHGFALSLLVSDQDYGAVAEWVNGAHLGDRLVYFRVRSPSGASRRRLSQHALANKVIIKDDTSFYDWLRRELDDRFDHACCQKLDEFRREEKAITLTGQIKTGGKRHEKDDRHGIGDRTRYVLGWSNESKIAALEKVAAGLEREIKVLAAEIAGLDGQRKTLQQRAALLNQLRGYASYGDLDWRAVALEIDRLQEERRQLEDCSDVLKTLKAQLDGVTRVLREGQAELDGLTKEHARSDERREQALRQLDAAREETAKIDRDARGELFRQLEAMRPAALGEHRLTVESCDNREHDMRLWVQTRMDNKNRDISRLRDKIVSAMRDYCNTFPQDTYEVDASVEAAGEYRKMLDALQSDGLPNFEARFKQLLNENTIREVAGFQSQLRRESQDIRERIATINLSLIEIDYNVGRYIVLEAQTAVDPEIRDFQHDLRACTENTLAGSEDSAYSEGKFLEVRRIIERLRGREGTTELDRRWTRKVTDVRNWFTFSASERWRSDGSEHEHYSDSGGKSGGQKEKLAYTVLAASLAYQFGLDWNAERSRSFHFVVIDEAFGRGSDESACYGLELFKKMGLQLLIATPLQKIHIIEPYVAAVGFVHNEEGRRSLLRNLTIEEYRAERMRRAG
jgi:uncharacterized protein YPO0396